MVRYVCIHTRRTLYSFSLQALSGAFHEIEFEGAPLFFCRRSGSCQTTAARELKFCMSETAKNFAKQASYQFVFAMIKDAIRHNYPLQAITLEESVMADRLWSALHASGHQVKNHETVGRALADWKKGKNFDEEMNSLKPQIEQWWKDRNELLHGLAKSDQGCAPEIRPEEFDEKAGATARFGLELTNAVSNWSKKAIRKVTRLAKKVKSVGAVIAIALLCNLASAAPTISGVTAQQRYPWNGKVDISYMASDVASHCKNYGLVSSLKVTATDKVANKTYTATKLSGDTALTDGTHKLVWDLDAQGLAIKSDNVVFNVACDTTEATYCVIDLSAGENATSYPVTYLASEPSGGFNVTAYKTSKLVLKRLAAGSFKMQGSTTTTLTKPFFMGLFEVTQKQWTLVMGSNPSGFSGDALPVEKVSYNMIRGSSEGAKWPASSAVDATSFLGKLQARTKLNFDLPTEAQWEYACRAGTTTTYSYGNSANGDYMWYTSNSGSKTHEVGTKKPNPWGLYDMHGNVWEWNLDWYGTLAYGTDPKGLSSGSGRAVRGGSWSNLESNCTSSYRNSSTPSSTSYSPGFRLSRTLP